MVATIPKRQNWRLVLVVKHAYHSMAATKQPKTPATAKTLADRIDRAVDPARPIQNGILASNVMWHDQRAEDHPEVEE